jgi:3',5'-cyclic-nucleotide phosphodiesterase
MSESDQTEKQLKSAELMIRRGPDSGKHVVLGQVLIIGRSSKKSINNEEMFCLTDSEISRKHIRIFLNHDQYYLEDLESTNGTLLRGKFVKSGSITPLLDGDEIYLGNSLIVFRTGEAGKQSLPNTKPIRKKPSTRKISELSDDFPPDVSMVINASDILLQLQSKSYEQKDQSDLLKRMQAMIQVSTALGAITNIDDLLTKVISIIFETFPGAERAIVIAFNEDSEDYYPLISRSRNNKISDNHRNIILSQTIINEVLRRHNGLIIMDALGDKRYQSQESIVDLNIRSVMAAPLLVENEVIGLIQLDAQKSTDLFSREDLELLTGISAQIAIYLKNSQLYEEIESLFEGFVKASVRVIEARDPGTAGHSFRVADYTENLTIAIDKSTEGSLQDYCFNKEQLQEIRYAALLHDFGKVGVRENILTKAKKLYPHELEEMKLRFKYAQTSLERQAYKDMLDLFEKGKISTEAFQQHRIKVEAELGNEIDRLDGFLQTILEANEPDYYYNKNKGNLHLLKDSHFLDRDMHRIQLLTDFEFSALSFSQGSLNPDERKQIESHVSHTYDFLRYIPWTTKFSAIPEIAHAHHERLNGTGYPQGLVGEQIPVQSRIMAIADIFDALTAGDRPYRDGVSIEIALNILEGEVKSEKLDALMFKVFVESRAYVVESHQDK